MRSAAQLRRKALAIPLAVVALALLPAGAWGVADVIKNSGNSFDRSTYFSDQGDLVEFQHSGQGAPHNVRSTQSSGGQLLFSSDTISTGTTPVDGTQYLAPGTYPFICTIHPTQMKADLVVRGAPPDGTTPPPDGTTPPVTEAPLTLDLAAKKQELRKKIKFFATASVASTLVAKGKKIKETTEQLAANQKTKVEARLKPKARRQLEETLEKTGKAKVKVQGTATTRSGATATDTVTVKLKD